MKGRRRFVLATVAVALCAPAPQAALGAAKVFETRDEIPIAYRWNLADILPTTEAFDEVVAQVEAALPKLEAFKGRLGESAETLAAAFALRYETARKVEAAIVYTHQWADQDTRDAKAKSFRERARSLDAKFQQAIAFFEPEIVAIPDDRLASFRKDPALATYDHVIDDIVRMKEHVRSAEVEEVLAGASLLMGVPDDAYGNLHDADIRWRKVKGADGQELTATPSLFYQLLSEPDRRVRKDAALAIFETYGDFGNTFASILGGSVQKDLWLARTRRYPSTFEMALDGDRVPRAVVDRLVEAVHGNLPVIHRYIALRKRLVGVDAVHIYDLYVPMTPAGQRSFTFDEGWKLAMEFWKETFGPEYAAVAARGLSERWVDVYPNEGKAGGAYSWGTYDAHPYLLLNWGGTLEDVFTLVHEMGHSIHTYLANEAQPYHLADYSLFVAELASVASESLFFEWLMKRTEDPAERLALIGNGINSFVGTFLRQIFFHEFELRMHERAAAGEPITKESLGRIWGDLWQTYYGPDAALDEAFRNGWPRIGHFYRTFYVWKYATSYAAGQALADRFRRGDRGAVADYLAALKLGGSVYPMEAIRRAGVDLEDPAVIGTVLTRFGKTLDELEALLD